MGLNVTTVLDGDYAVITSAGASSGEVARALLDAADDPSQVRTTTGTGTGAGWRVPKKVATKAGFIDSPRKGGRRSERVTPDA